MKITFIGAAREVTGSCTLIEACGKKILVDCGMEQGADIYENRELPVAPGDIDFIFLTHAHIDHSGKLPLLVKNRFSGKIYATDATRRLCAIMLEDSARIQENEAIWRNRRAKRSGRGEYEPLYSSSDVVETIKLFEVFGYDMEFFITDNISAGFFDAGHLLGSSSVKLHMTENGKTETVIFSGDIGNPMRPLLRDPTLPDKADAVIIESTYGNRIHDKLRPDYEQKLAQVLSDAFARKGNVVIPAFAVGRTQELLYLIRRIKEKKLIPYDFPVYLDSPLAIEATNIYGGNLKDYYDEETLGLLARGINPIKFNGLITSVTSEESKAINSDPSPKVIISASGMCEAGRIRHHLKYNLWRPECTVLFVGYQVPGTLGRKLLDGEKYVNLLGEDIKVCAHIEQLEGISAHADKNMLLKWLGAMTVPPRRVYVNHGDDETCEEFAKTVKEKLGVIAVAPYSGGSYDLISDACLDRGNTTKIQKTEQSKGRIKTPASVTWSKLYAAGVRLMSIIENSRGRKEKELAAFSNQTNALCNKWERKRKRNK